MRRIALILLVLTIGPALADVAPNGGYYGSYAGGGFFVRYYFYDLADVSENFGGNFFVLGGRGYGAVNDWLRLGGCGGGSIAVLDEVNEAENESGVGFGGLTVEPYLLINDWLSVSLPVLLGAGGYEFRHLVEDYPGHEYRFELYESGFWLVDPCLEVMLKPNYFMGVGLQGGYSLLLQQGEVFESSAYVGFALYFGMP
jgi:hypothetical protein